MKTLAPDSGRELCAVLGHELRNPLASAITSLMVATELTDENDPRDEFLTRARHDLERLSGLLASYLDFGVDTELRRTEVLVELREAIDARQVVELRHVADRDDPEVARRPLTGAGGRVGP